MMKDAELESLWSTGAPAPALTEARLGELPPLARTYLRRALPIGIPLARAVRLHMRGEFRIGSRWRSFRGLEVLHAQQGFVWLARMRMFGLPLSGSDRFVDGKGTGKWSLFGALPVAQASGPDVARSGAQRAQIEGVWLPSAFLERARGWYETDSGHLAIDSQLYEHRSRALLELDARGDVSSASMQRFGTPDGPAGEFRSESFGCLVEQQGSFAGYRIPTRLRVGWYPGTARFEAEGEFFRAQVTNAQFR